MLALTLLSFDFLFSGNEIWDHRPCNMCQCPYYLPLKRPFPRLMPQASSNSFTAFPAEDQDSVNEVVVQKHFTVSGQYESGFHTESVER